MKSVGNWRFFPALLPQKMKLADDFMGENWHKIVRGVPSVSFFSRPTLDGFIILAP